MVGQGGWFCVGGRVNRWNGVVYGGGRLMRWWGVG